MTTLFHTISVRKTLLSFIVLLLTSVMLGGILYAHNEAELGAIHVEQLRVVGNKQYFKVGDTITVEADLYVGTTCVNGITVSIPLLVGNEYIMSDSFSQVGNSNTYRKSFVVQSNFPNGKIHTANSNAAMLLCSKGQKWHGEPIGYLPWLEVFWGDPAYIRSLWPNVYIDKVAPQISSASIHAVQPVFGVGEVIPISVTFSERVNVSGNLEIMLNSGGKAAYQSGSGTSTLHFEYIVQSGDTTGAAFLDLLSFSGTGAIEDLAGNTLASNSINMTLDDNIIIDTQPPQLTFTYDSSSSTEYAKQHDIIASATDGVRGSDNLTLFYTWSTDRLAPIDWSVVTDLAMNESPVPNPNEATGEYYIHMRVIDDVSNETIDYAGPFHFDNEPPTVQFISNSGSVGSSYATQIVVSDQHSDVNQFSYTWINVDTNATYGPYTGRSGDTVTTPELLAEGAYELIVTASDSPGNESETRSERFLIDKTPPKILFTTEGNAQPSQAEQVEMTLSDEHGTLADAYYVWTTSFDPPAESSSEWKLIYDGSDGIAQYVTTVDSPLGANGLYYLHVKAYDNAGSGKGGNVAFASTKEGFFFDNEPPLITFSLNGNASYVTSVDTELRITDGALPTSFDEFTVRYLVTTELETDWVDTDWDVLDNAQLSFSDMSGIYYIHVTAYDQAGNRGKVTSAPFYFDNTGPEGSIHITTLYTNETEVSLELTANDHSAPFDMSFSLDGGEQWTAWEPFTTLHRIHIQPSEGEQTIFVRYKDALGNIGEKYAAQVIYDITKPEAVDVTYSTEQWTNEPVIATVTLADNFTSPDDIIITNHHSTTYVFDDNHTFELAFKDLAGNMNSVILSVDNIERISPTIALSTDGNQVKSKAVSTTISVTDNESKPENIEVYYEWSLDSLSEPTAWQRVMNGETVAKTDGDGTWYLWIKAVDEAGNIAIYRSLPYLLDNTNPIGTVSYSIENRTAMPVTAHLTTNEAVTIISPENGLNQYTFTENGVFLFEFYDEAGNYGSAEAIVTNIDTSLPTAEVTMNPAIWTNSNVEVTVDVSGLPPRTLFDIQAPQEAKLIRLETLEYGTITEPQADATVTKVVYDFTMNGQLSFKILDLDTGLQSDEEIVIVNQIDIVPPTAELFYSTTEWTNENVTVIATIDDDRSGAYIVNNNGSNTYVFEENGTFEFIISDGAGNIIYKEAVVHNIDKEVPQPVLTYSHQTWTNEDVAVTISFDNETEPVTITNNGGSDSYIFRQNGSFTFHYVDVAGNVGQATATVDYIDREAPNGHIVYSQTQWTNQDVEATFIGDDNSGVAPIVINNEGSNAYVFTENGSFIFIVQDAAGNIREFTASVDRIDKQKPLGEVVYSTLEPTNGNVRAVVHANEPITVMNHDGRNYYNFTDNGEVEFHIVDRAGNENIVTAKVDHIDRTPPVPILTYSETAPTNQSVVVTVSANEPIYVLNNGRRNQYVFDENGSFTFLIQDVAGNTAEVEAVVNYIDSSKANITLEYSEDTPTRQPVTVTIQSDRPLTFSDDSEGDTLFFADNGVRWVRAQDDLGNDYTIEVRVDHIDREAPQIYFSSGEYLLVPFGSVPNVMQGVIGIDNVDGDMTEHIQVEHHIDPTKLGEYEVTYTLLDRAGNQNVTIRKVLLIPTGQFTAFINSVPSDGSVIVLHDPNVFVQLFGQQGDYTVKWAEGKRERGYFKANGQLMDGMFMAERSSFYTVYIQDQERQSKLIHVYVYR